MLRKSSPQPWEIKGIVLKACEINIYLFIYLFLNTPPPKGDELERPLTYI